MRKITLICALIVSTTYALHQDQERKKSITTMQEEVAYALVEGTVLPKLDHDQLFWKKKQGKSIDSLTLYPKEDVFFCRNIEMLFIKDSTIFISGNVRHVPKKVLDTYFKEADELVKDIVKLRKRIDKLAEQNKG